VEAFTRPLIRSQNALRSCGVYEGRYFNASGQAELYELRILQDKERIKASIYVAENQLDNEMTKYLARAIRSYLTRSDVARREGFSDSVGDMLALNYYREALEVKGEEREAFAQKGVDCATSSEAKLNCQRLLLLDTSGEQDELSVRARPVYPLHVTVRSSVTPAHVSSRHSGHSHPANPGRPSQPPRAIGTTAKCIELLPPADASSHGCICVCVCSVAQKYASLPAVALDEHEEAFWPMPVLGTLETVTSSLFSNVPFTNTEGPFNLFKASGGVRSRARSSSFLCWPFVLVRVHEHETAR
jgi:hypothetical protein